MEQERTTKDLFHVAGDSPDPTGTGALGVSAGYDLTKTALGHPMLLWKVAGKELVLEADVYALPDQPMHIYILCPQCLINGHQNQLAIKQNQKAFSYDPMIEPPVFPGWTVAQMREAFPRGVGGRLSVEPFRCTWEEAPELERGFGLGRCTWSVSIDNNVVRPA